MYTIESDQLISHSFDSLEINVKIHQYGVSQIGPVGQKVNINFECISIVVIVCNPLGQNGHFCQYVQFLNFETKNRLILLQKSN